MTKTTSALPERYRLARNIEKGYQLHAQCDEHEGGHWVTVTSALHLLSPIKISTFTLDAPDCIPDARQISEWPGDELMSRRPAPVGGAA